MSKKVREAKHKRLVARAPYKTRIYNQCSAVVVVRHIRDFGVSFAFANLHQGLLPGCN
jgi:hypothetical protein